MATGAKICPFCGKLNAREDTHCVRCERRMPGQTETAARGLAFGLLGSEYPLTKIMLASSLLIYGAMALAGPDGGSLALRWGALRGGVADAPWRYLSAMFVHFGLMHIGFNSLMLYQLGRTTEAHLGWPRFVVVFLVSGAIGFWVGEFWTTLGTPSFWGHATTGGLSGGLFGLLGVTVGWRWAAGDPEWKRLAMTGAMYGVLMMFLMPSGVNHAAHWGGLVSGASLGAALYRWGRPRKLNSAFALGAVLLLAVALLGVAIGPQLGG